MFHERLEKLRIKRGISKAEFCRQIKMPPTTYSGYALGTREPDLDTVVKFANFYGVSIDYLVNGTTVRGEFQNKIDQMLEDFVDLNPSDQERILSLMERMKNN